MTDLERVRDALRRLAVIGEHELAAAIMNIAQEAKEELDAHLEKDAERVAGWQQTHSVLVDELARLREHLALEHSDENTYMALKAELAGLREALRIIAKNGSYSDALLAAEALRGESDG